MRARLIPTPPRGTGPPVSGPPTPETGGFQRSPQVPSPQPAIPWRNSGNGLNGETSATRDPADPGGDSTDGPRSGRVRVRRHPIRHRRSGRSNGPVQSGSTAGHHGGHFSDAVRGGPSGSPVLGPTTLTVGSSAGGFIPRAVAGNSRCVATGSSSHGSCSRGRSGIAPTSVSAWLRIPGTTVMAAPTKRVMTDGSSSTTACNPSPRMPEPAGGGGPTNSAGSGRPVAHRPRRSDDVSPDRGGVETVTRR